MKNETKSDPILKELKGEKIRKNFYCVNIEYSGILFGVWGGGWAVLAGGGRKARIGVGDKMPVSGYNTATPSPLSPTP